MMSVCVVNVSGFKSDVLSADALISGLRKRYPNAEGLIQSSEAFLCSKVPSFFYGAVHAEATLMGLTAHALLDERERKRDTGCIVHYAGVQQFFLEEMVSPAIAVGKKCCWCCKKLSELIEPSISIPGSHGIIYSWCPPRIGVSLNVLEELEGQLWRRLHQALLEHRAQIRGAALSRQSSGSSSLETVHVANFPYTYTSTYKARERLL